MNPSTRSPGVLRVLLGVFVLVQLAFLVLANLGTFFLQLGKMGNPVAEKTWGVIGTVTEPYAWATGQEQYWKMFAPTGPPRAAFVRIRLQMDDQEIVRVPSEFEAAPGQPLFHWPGAGERLWHVEKSLALQFVAYDRDWVLAETDGWRSRLTGFVEDHRHRFLPYMAWRARRHGESTGDSREATQIEFLVSIHSRSRHDRPSTPEFEELVLRWRPETDILELCTPTTAGFDCRPLVKK